MIKYIFVVVVFYISESVGEREELITLNKYIQLAFKRKVEKQATVIYYKVGTYACCVNGNVFLFLKIKKKIYKIFKVIWKS